MEKVRSKLTEEEVKEVLSRAHEIHSGSEGVETEDIIRAAEETGLPREAVERALRERLDLPEKPPKEGELSFAKSTDGRFYVAEVITVNEGSVRVRFLKGGESELPHSDLRAASFLPGQKIVCEWKSWGWWTCTVLSYNEAKRRVKVTDGWGSTETFPISEVRLDPPRKPMSLGSAKALFVSYFLGLVSGGFLSGVAWWLFLR